MSTTTKSEVINIEDSHASKTIKAFREEYRKKGLEPDPETDFPRDENVNLQKLRDFNAQVDPSRPITKRIISMVRQPVSVTVNGKREVKDSLIYHTEFTGYNHADIRRSVEADYGYHLRPDLQFQILDPNRPFDPSTGQKRGKYSNSNTIWEHTIFLPDKQQQRSKFLN